MADGRHLENRKNRDISTINWHNTTRLSSSYTVLRCVHIAPTDPILSQQNNLTGLDCTAWVHGG